MPETSALYEHLQLVRSRPRIYIGGHGIDRLNAHLFGWKAHRHHFPDGDAWAEHFFADFHKYVAAQYGERRNMDWDAVIRTQETDPRKQVVLFYDLLDGFCAGG
jgi:hypothetical protein